MNYTSVNPHRFTEAATAGFRVFPVVERGKEPIGKWAEYRDRPPTGEGLAAWDASDFNVAIITGEPSGVVVLDLDSPEAIEAVERLNLPSTPTARTARGLHLYFRRPAGGLRNKVGVGGIKMDVRGDGGYVVAPGSVHESGVRYEWVTAPGEVPFAEFPLTLQQMEPAKERAKRRLATPSSAQAMEANEGPLRYIANAAKNAAKEITEAEDGKRNNTLFRVAVAFARDCAGACTEWSDYVPPLAEAALAIGLAPNEVEATLESARVAGSAEPTPWLRTASEYVYLGAQDQFYHVESQSYLKRTGFDGSFGHQYSGDGSFTHFLLSAGYIRKFQDIMFDPFDPNERLERQGATFLNTYKPSPVVALEGDATPFVEFLTHLVPEDSEREHLVKMIAWTVRYPGQKLSHALLLRTQEQGTGKSTLLSIWGELMGESNVRKTTSKELNSDYQGYLPGRLLILCEELNLGQGHRVYNDLKDLITGDKAIVNEKYLRQRLWPNYASFAFLTNLAITMLIEDKDRRFFFIDSPATRREADYYVRFNEWWRANLGVIRHYLDQVDLTEFKPYAPPPMTTAKQRLIEHSRSELAQDLALMIQERAYPFARDVVTLEQVKIGLGHLSRDLSSKRLIKALEEVGAVKLGQQRMPGGTRASLWAIRNRGLWLYLPVSDRAEEYAREVGLYADYDVPGLAVAHEQGWNGDFTGLMGAMLLGDPDIKEGATNV